MLEEREKAFTEKAFDMQIKVWNGLLQERQQAKELNLRFLERCNDIAAVFEVKDDGTLGKLYLKVSLLVIDNIVVSKGEVIVEYKHSATLALSTFAEKTNKGDFYG